MKVDISVDMAGIAGVGHPNPTGRGGQGYPVAAYRGFLAGVRLGGIVD